MRRFCVLKYRIKSLLYQSMKSIQIRSFFWSVFSPNTEKYGPEKTPYLETFHAVYFSITMFSSFINSALIKLMKRYLCSGFLIWVEPNWCFSHPMLPLEFLFKIIVTNFPEEFDTIIDLLIHRSMTIFCFLQQLNCTLDNGYSIYDV